MASIAPMPQVNNANMDIGRPGQQLLPGYVVKLLKTLKIPFGTDRTMNGVDVDPTIALVGHVIDCLGALRDINKVYRAKGSLASRSVGTRVMFGFTAELGNILLDSITFEPPADLSDSAIYYGQVASSILSVFPEIAAQVTPATGKVLAHHTALKTSRTMAMESIKMVVKAFPAGAWTADRTGALPLHWVTHNPNCSQEMINFIINANPKGPWVADMDGYLPLHWAVNQDFPNIDVIAALIAANASAAAKACTKGSLPLHWAVNRERPHIGVMRALLQVHADGVRTFDKTGWLPIHQCVNRSDISLEALQLLVELYPQGLQCPNVNGQLPLHRALDQTTPHVEAIQMMLEAFPGSTKVADDEGYLPIHLALDCARPNPVIAKMLLDHYPESAFHKSKDGLLPIHCIISSMTPVIEIIQQLLVIFPDSTESMAVDVIPVDENADPETWQGEWIEKRWTPLSRAIDRGLDAIVMLFRDALGASKAAAAASGGGPNFEAVRGRQNQLPALTASPSTATPKTLIPQAMPPINSTTSAQQQTAAADSHSPVGGPSTSSVEGGPQRRQLVPGGNLDGRNFDSEGEELHQQMMNAASSSRQRPTDEDIETPGGKGSNAVPPLGSPPPALKDRAPGGMSARQPLSRGNSLADVKIRDPKDRRRDRDSSRDRDRDRRHRHRHHHRDDDDDDDYDSRHRHRSSSRRRGGGDRSGSRGHRDRDSRDRHRHHRSKERDRDRESRERIYENGEYDDDDEEQGRGHSRHHRSHHRRDGDGNSGGGGKTRIMTVGAPPKDPPKSLLEAASNRPTTRRGADEQPAENSPGVQSTHSRDEQYEQHPGRKESTAIDMDSNARHLTVDELV